MEVVYKVKSIGFFKPDLGDQMAIRTVGKEGVKEIYLYDNNQIKVIHDDDRMQIHGNYQYTVFELIKD
jgi:hypothetical protein